MSEAAPATARRYARALLDVALQQKKAEAIRDELAGMVALIAAHPDLESILAHPAVSAERKRKVVGAVADAAKVSDLMTRLLTIMGERDRLSLLPVVADAYAKLWNAHRGVVAAEAVSAVPLDETQVRAVREALAAASGRQVDLTSRVDSRLLGGMLVNMEGRTYDGSVRARLGALRRTLAGTAGPATPPRQQS